MIEANTHPLVDDGVDDALFPDTEFRVGRLDNDGGRPAGWNRRGLNSPVTRASRTAS